MSLSISFVISEHRTFSPFSFCLASHADSNPWAIKTTSHLTIEDYGCEEGTTYAFWYPDDEITQYFYESFPEVTTPMAGIMNDRFFVWMRTAVQPKFRKLYAVIGDDIRKGDEVKLSVGANFDVSNFHGTKSLVLTTTTWFGGKNSFLGNGFIVVGAAYLVFGVAFAVKHQNSPRALGDTRFLETPTLKSKTA